MTLSTKQKIDEIENLLKQKNKFTIWHMTKNHTKHKKREFNNAKCKDLRKADKYI